MTVADMGPTDRRTHAMNLMADMVVAEYQTLRAEIGRLQDHQQQILNFGFLALAAVVAGFGSALAGPQHTSLAQALQDYHLLLLVIPLVYLFLAALFAERTIRIMRVGDY